MISIAPIALLVDKITDEVLIFDDLDDAKEELRVLWSRHKGSVRLIIHPGELEYSKHLNWIMDIR